MWEGGRDGWRECSLERNGLAGLVGLIVNVGDMSDLASGYCLYSPFRVSLEG